MPAFKALPKVSIDLAVDVSEKSALKLSKMFGIPSFGTSPELIWEDPNIDFVVITVPPKYHAQIALSALKAGKHILIEKPFTSTLDDAKKLLQSARKTGLTTGVVHNRRFYPTIRNAKQSLNDGKLGTIYQAHFASMIPGPSIGYPASEWHFNHDIAGGGVAMDQGTHTVDLIRWLLGDIEQVYATSADVFEDLEVEVAISAILSTTSGVNCVLQLSWINDFTMCPFQLWGTSGAIFVEPMFGLYEEIHGPRNPAERWIRLTQTLFRFAYTFLSQEGSPTHLSLIHDFLSSIRKGKRPLVDFEDGFKSIQIIDALYKSIHQDKVIDL